MYVYRKLVFAAELLFRNNPTSNWKAPKGFCRGNQGIANFWVSLCFHYQLLIGEIQTNGKNMICIARHNNICNISTIIDISIGSNSSNSHNVVKRTGHFSCNRSSNSNVSINHPHCWTVLSANHSQCPTCCRRKIFYMHRRHKFMSRWGSMRSADEAQLCSGSFNTNFTLQDGETHQQIPRVASPQAHEVRQWHPARPGGEWELHRPLQPIEDTSVSSLYSRPLKKKPIPQK